MYLCYQQIIIILEEASQRSRIITTVVTPAREMYQILPADVVGPDCLDLGQVSSIYVSYVQYLWLSLVLRFFEPTNA